MKRANIIVSTLYESLSSSAIDCAGFVLAVEDGLRRFPDLQILDREDRSVEYFFVHLVFDEIDDELRAAAVAVGFHTSNLLEPPEGSDYFLRQFAGHFNVGYESDSASALVSALRQEIDRRIEQGWLEP